MKKDVWFRKNDKIGKNYS